MGVLIRCNDADFTNYVGIADFPIIPELKNLYYFGGTADKSKADHSGNGNDGTAFEGEETFNTNSVLFEGSGSVNFMRVPAGTAGVTSVHAVALVKKTGSRGVYAAIASSSAGGYSFGTARAIYKDDVGAWVDAQFTLPDANGYYAMAWSITSSGISVYLLNGKNELVTIKTVAGGPLASNTQRKTIGGTNYNWSMNGSAEIAVVGGYEGDVSTDELRNALIFLRSYGEIKGLTVI